MRNMQSASKIEHLNGALRAIRNVNRLLVRENDRDRLLEAICRVLIESRSYDRTWILILDDSGQPEAWAESGIGRAFETLVTSGRFRAEVPCVRHALSQKDPVFIENPATACPPCPLVTHSAGWGALTVRLEHAGKIYGLMSVSIPRELIPDDVEKTLIEEIAGDIAFGIYRLKREEAHRKTDAALEKRVNELNWFFSFATLVEKPGISLGDILQGGVALLAAAMQYPQIACARAVIGDRRYATENFATTRWQMSREIRVHDKAAGVLEVGYLEERPPEFSGPFQKEENQLLNAVAMRMGRVIERKRARKALEDSERRFRDLVENSMTCIAILQGGRAVYVNPEYERLFGSARKTLIPPDPALIHPDDFPVVDGAIADFMASRHEAIDLEFRLCSPDCDSPAAKWVHCRVCRIEHRGKGATLLNLMDISRAKELEYLLRIRDKMTSLGRVATGIAHEIRNPLSGINIYLRALEKSYAGTGSPEDVTNILSQLQSASNKIESVIKRVMDFSRPSEPTFVLTEINLPVEEAVELSSATLRKKGIRVKMDLDPNLPPCRSDPHMIEQVILNLISNASEAMAPLADGKQIRVTTTAGRGFVRVAVSDSGPGVPKNIAGNIFDPFYTTKNNSSGIGLSICHRIITDHKGSLQVESSEFGGARFVVQLPVDTHPHTAQQPPEQET